MPGADEIRATQRATWAGLSAGWEKWDSVIVDQLGPVGSAMIDRLGSDPQLASVLANAAAASRARGDHDEARARYQRALTRFEAAGMSDQAERVRGRPDQEQLARDAPCCRAGG